VARRSLTARRMVGYTDSSTTALRRAGPDQARSPRLPSKRRSRQRARRELHVAESQAPRRHPGSRAPNVTVSPVDSPWA
jgi:hypothetical protein